MANKKTIVYKIDNDCHICTSHYINNKGYPSFCWNGKLGQMSHYIYEKENKCSILKKCGNEFVAIMHSCDNRACINPDHLSLGTNKENSLDMVRKGRTSGRLTWEIVRLIRINETLSLKELAKLFKVTSEQISNIKRNLSWRIN